MTINEFMRRYAPPPEALRSAHDELNRQEYERMLENLMSGAPAETAKTGAKT